MIFLILVDEICDEKYDGFDCLKVVKILVLSGLVVLESLGVWIILRCCFLVDEDIIVMFFLIIVM